MIFVCHQYCFPIVKGKAIKYSTLYHLKNLSNYFFDFESLSYKKILEKYQLLSYFPILHINDLKFDL
jgi:hypothetical protein